MAKTGWTYGKDAFGFRSVSENLFCLKMAPTVLNLEWLQARSVLILRDVLLRNAPQDEAEKGRVRGAASTAAPVIAARTAQ